MQDTPTQERVANIQIAILLITALLLGAVCGWQALSIYAVSVVSMVLIEVAAQPQGLN